MVFATKTDKSRSILLSAFCLVTAGSVGLSAAPVSAAPDPKAVKTVPSGTLLMPMTPKLDGAVTPSILAPGSGFLTPRSPSLSFPQATTPEAAATPAVKPAKSKPVAAAPAKSVQTKGTTASSPKEAAKTLKPTTQTATAAPAVTAPTIVPPRQPDSIVNELGAARPRAGKVPVAAAAPEKPATPADEIDEQLARIPEETDNSLLKGTVQIIADDTEYDQQRNTFLGTGNAVATIAGQDSRLEADMILYDQANQMIDARGNVKIIREGQLSTGSAFKFKVGTDEYLITQPNTEVSGTQVVARSGYGTKQGMAFKQGKLTLPTAIHIARNPFNGTIQSVEDTYQKDLHPDAYAPANPSFTFKARKMVYEKYKDTGNLTIFGGKLKFKNFTVPLGKFQTTVGKESKVTFPVTPIIGNNLQVGGLNFGPSFNSAIGTQGKFFWAPLIQSGGRTTNGATNRGSIGAGVRIGYEGKRLSSNLAYGSVSNLLVGDIRYIVNQHTTFQAGINRFLPDGIFGARRARAIAEVVDWRGMGGIPFIQGLAFRSSAGWMSDQPSLVNLTPEYAKLFTQTNGNITTGFRIQEQLMTTSEPIFNIGDRKWGASMNVFGGVAAKAYSTGNSMLMGQVGPVLNVNLNRVRLQGQVAKSGVQGSSPFVFDQFIQGNKSCSFGGDVKLCKWLTVGGNLGYNLDSKLLYQRSISAAIGPEDFKILLTRDTIRGINRFGFDVMMGKPIPFNKLVLKGNPDHGQLGGGI